MTTKRTHPQVLDITIRIVTHRSNDSNAVEASVYCHWDFSEQTTKQSSAGRQLQRTIQKLAARAIERACDRAGHDLACRAAASVTAQASPVELELF